jgi:hypothetical protein
VVQLGVYVRGGAHAATVDRVVELMEQVGSSSTLADIVSEARRILAAGDAAELPVRLLGGIAFHLRGGPAVPMVLQRAYGDIDLVVPKGGSRAVSELLERFGYSGDRAFNVVNGSRRLLFHDHPRSRQIDVFVGTFEMCHSIPLADRLECEPETVPAAELILTKLQIINVNDKDQRDVASLLSTHTVSDTDGERRINAARVAELLSSDWGLWRTSLLNVERLHQRIGAFGLSDVEQQAVLEQLDSLWDVVEASPKSRGWKLRARVGDRKRWYEEPEEVE